MRCPEWLNGLTLAYVLIYALGVVLTTVDSGFAGVHDPDTDCLRSTRRMRNFLCQANPDLVTQADESRLAQFCLLLVELGVLYLLHHSFAMGAVDLTICCEHPGMSWVLHVQAMSIPTRSNMYD